MAQDRPIQARRDSVSLAEPAEAGLLEDAEQGLRGRSVHAFLGCLLKLCLRDHLLPLGGRDGGDGGRIGER
eukprot:14161526-Alexandrium_andersonii.AAC.1